MIQDSAFEFRETLEQALSNREDKDDIIDEVDVEVGGLLAKFAKQFFSRLAITLAITIDEFSG